MANTFKLFGVNRSNLPRSGELEAFSAQRAVKIEWIKGHAGAPHNEAMAKRARKAAMAANEAMRRRMKRAA